MTDSRNTKKAPPKRSPESVRAYNRARNWFFVVGILWSVVTSIAFILSGASNRIAKGSRTKVGNERGGEALAITIFTLLSWLASVPLSYMRGYRTEHRYELSNQTHASWMGDQLKGLALQVTLGLPVTQIALAIIRRRPRDWWMVLTLLALPFTVLLAHLFPVLIAPIFNTYRPLRDQQLADRLTKLASRSGIKVAEVLEMDMSKQTKKANAFFAGIGNTKRIVLADTLLDEFTNDEIETVVAHEIAHQAHGDLWRLLGLVIVTTGVLAWLTQRGTERLMGTGVMRQRGITNPGSAEALPLLSLVAGTAGLLFMPLQNAASRYVERQADQYALELTGNPDAFASALGKLADMNLSDPEPPKLEEFMLYSHPSIRSRIRACEAFAIHQKET